MDVRYTLFFLFLFLLGLVRNSVNAMENDPQIDFLDVRTINYDNEIEKHRGIAQEIVVTFNFDDTTMPDKKDNKKNIDVRLIKKSGMQ